MLFGVSSNSGPDEVQGPHGLGVKIQLRWFPRPKLSLAFLANKIQQVLYRLYPSLYPIQALSNKMETTIVPK